MTDGAHKMTKKSFHLIGYGVAIVTMGWLFLSSISFVDTKEVGVVYRLGKWHRTLPAGIHLTFPFPIEDVEKLPFINTRNVDIHMPRLLTGDANLIEAKLVVQYDIIDPNPYVLSHAKTDAVLTSLLASTLIRVVGHSAIDQETFINRNRLENQIRTIGQNNIDQLNLGISLRSVGFQELSAPKAVIEAFNEISSARGEKDTMILSAQSYASKALPSARGDAQKFLEEAHADHAQIINLAKTRRTRFASLLPLWNSNPDVLRSTLKAQTWKAIQDKITVHHVSDGDQLILPAKPRETP